jgi:hypothetical protein
MAKMNNKINDDKEDGLPSSKKSYFIAEFALKTNNFQERKVLIKFNALTSIYNQLLNHLFKQDERMKSDPLFIQLIGKWKDNKKQLIDMKNSLLLLNNKKNLTKEDKNKVIELKKSLKTEEEIKKNLQNQFTVYKEKYCLHYPYIENLATSIKKNSWMAEHLDSHTVQTTAKRVYSSWEDFIFKRKGKPRFRTEKRFLRSATGKQNTCISFNKKFQVKWKDVIFDVIEEKDIYGVQRYAKQKIDEGCLKYSRIVRRKINGKNRFFVQCVIEGEPLLKPHNAFNPELLNQTVAMDIGVSTVALVAEKVNILCPFAPTVMNAMPDIKALQRLLNRSTRINNPDCFEPDTYTQKVKHIKRVKGKNKKGYPYKIKSKSYTKKQAKLSDSHRKMEVSRKQQHNELSNFILRKGYHLKIEKNNYKAWQRGWFGRTILNKAPGMLESILKRKAENAGGSVEFIDPFKSKFSQFCHKCSSYHNKTLSERIHMCNGEPVAQRDLYSAFLIYHYDIKKNSHGANEENFNVFKKQTIDFKGFHEKDYINNFSMQGMGTVLSNKTHNEAFHCDKLTRVLDNSNPPLKSMGESVLPKVLKNVNITFPH